MLTVESVHRTHTPPHETSKPVHGHTETRTTKLSIQYVLYACLHPTKVDVVPRDEDSNTVLINETMCLNQAIREKSSSFSGSIPLTAATKMELVRHGKSKALFKPLRQAIQTASILSRIFIISKFKFYILVFHVTFEYEFSNQSFLDS